MLQAAESLIPILLLVVLGAFLFRSTFLSAEVRSGMDRFTYWVALPSLFLSGLSGADFRALEPGGLLLAMALGFTAAAILAAILGAVMGLGRENFGVFVQAGFRGNLAFVGLPLIIFAVGSGPQGGDELVAAALIAIAAMVPLINALSVLSLILAQHRLRLAILPRLLRELITNPLILSALLGGALGWMGWGLPVIVDRPLTLLGQTALALALLSLGGALVQFGVKNSLGLSLVAGTFKVTVVPLATYAFAVLFRLPPEQMLVAMTLAACPSAAASYIMTTQLGGNHALAASAIVMSTALSVVSLTFVLAWF